MGAETISAEYPPTLRARSDHPTHLIDVYSEPIKKVPGFLEVSPPTVTKVRVGYTFKVLGVEGSCYRVETYSGKVGYVLKDNLVPPGSNKHEDSYPKGIRVKRTIEISSHRIFAVDEQYTNGIPVYEEPSPDSKQLFILGPLEAVPILDDAVVWYYNVLLPGSSEGFVYRNLGTRRHWAPEVESHFGYYGVKKDKARAGGVRYAPDIHSEPMMNLNTFFRLPVVEEWDNWFRVQLPDGSLGFVPEAYGTRAITATTLVDTPSEGSGSPLAGLLKVAGLAGMLVVGTVGAALKESLEEDW